MVNYFSEQTGQTLAPAFANLPLFMTPAQLSAVTGEHEGSIRRGIRKGRIPADKVNGRWLICRDVVFGSAKGAMNVQDD